MVHVYRAAIYVIMIIVALLFYLLLHRLFGKRTRVVPVVVALLAATGLIWGTHLALSKRPLVAKYAPFLKIRKPSSKISMVLSQSEVRICNLDGSGDKLFLPRDFITTRDITWSFDGTRIICSRFRSGEEGMQLFIYEANGQNPVQVTSGSGVSRRPSWSSDGTRIAFDYRPSLRGKTTDICVVNIDGSGRQRLTARDQIHAYHPVWSPDGHSIYCCVKPENRRGDIWVMDADGGNLRQLTFTPGQAETEPAVSPDGRTIALSIDRKEIYLMDADGGRLRPLKTEEGLVCRGRDPSWSADGQRILFAGLGTTESRRFITEIGVDGRGRRQIPVQEGKLLTPVLNPNGTRLAYLRIFKPVIEKVSRPKVPAG